MKVGGRKARTVPHLRSQSPQLSASHGGSIIPKELKYAVKRERGYWAEVRNQKAFLERIAPQLDIINLTDWYRVPRQEIIKRGGRGLFRHYPTLGHALKTIYPQQTWQLSHFIETKRHPTGYWQDTQNLRLALEKAEEKLGIKQPEDWYTVALSDLKEVGFPSGFNRKQLVGLLSERYPNHQWERVYLLKGRFGQQKRLEHSIASLFPTFDIRRNVRKEAGLINPQSGDYLELDIWIPSLNIAFEYQDAHHYTSSDYAYQPLSNYQTKDEMKRKLASDKGITLITVPCWWDDKEESLVATIKNVRPELLIDHPTQEGAAIPDTPPPGYFDTQTPEIEGIGKPITACFLTRSHVDPSNWWIFEKYDGVRAFWNPTKKALYSRHGNQFVLPQHITDSFPNDLFLDGELWFGRDNFKEATKIANRVDASAIDWTQFKYMVFDIPSNTGNYKERYEQLEKYLSEHSIRYVELASKVECKDEKHLEEIFQNIIVQGGEGIILRDPLAPYEAGRSKGYLKHKKFRDAEARVVGYAGAHQWECELPNGVRFTAAAGTSEFVKKWKLKEGDIVSFKHRGFLIASKKPKLPSLHRVRTDLTWQDVVEGWKEQKPTNTTSSGLPSLKRTKKKHKPKGFWSNKDNARQFFDELATELGFDPSDVEYWNNISKAQVIARKGGASLLWTFNGSLRKALQSIYPNLAFNFTVRSSKPKEYWKEIRACRTFFDSFATEKGLNPIDINTWYSNTTLDNLVHTKEGQEIHEKQRGIKNALRGAYPELNFTEWEKVPQKEKWRDTRPFRTFFDAFAKEKGFSPTEEANWYTVDKAELNKKASGITFEDTDEGYKAALLLAYPNVQFSNWQHL